MCPSCQASRETNGLCTQFNTPQCLFCTARHIQTLSKLKTVTADAIIARRLVVLADAVAYGHLEPEVRRLVAIKEPALEPLELKRKG